MPYIGNIIIGQALVWGAVAILIAFRISGSGLMAEIGPILAVGGTFSMFILLGAAARYKKTFNTPDVPPVPPANTD